MKRKKIRNKNQVSKIENLSQEDIVAAEKLAQVLLTQTKEIEKAALKVADIFITKIEQERKSKKK